MSLHSTTLDNINMKIWQKVLKISGFNILILQFNICATQIVILLYYVKVLKVFSKILELTCKKFDIIKHYTIF